MFFFWDRDAQFPRSSQFLCKHYIIYIMFRQNIIRYNRDGLNVKRVQWWDLVSIVMNTQLPLRVHNLLTS
jgi:hypothetical protein